MASPAFQAVSNVAGHSATTGALAVAWPTHVTNDVALLFIERAGGSAATSLSTPAGFVQIGTDATTGATTAGTKLGVYWCRATSGAMSTPTIAASADHQFAVMVTFRGVRTTGNPYTTSNSGTKATASTTATIATLTTTVTESLSVLAITKDLDNASAFVTSMTNANLSSLSEHFDVGTTSGGGGGISVWSGGIETLRSTGSTTVTVTSSINAYAHILLAPEPMALSQDAFRFYEDGTESGSTAIDAQNTDITRDVTADSNLALRVRVKESNAIAGSSTDDYQLQYSLNSGSYVNVGSPANIPASDPDNVWTDENNLFDTSIATAASISTAGSASTNYIEGSGTNAPASGATITLVRARVYSSPSFNQTMTVYDGVTSLGTLSSPSSVTGYSIYTSLSAPSGGWTWAKLQQLRLNSFMYTSGTKSLHQVELEVTSDAVHYYYFDNSYSAGAPVPLIGFASSNLTDGNATTNRLGDPSIVDSYSESNRDNSTVVGYSLGTITKEGQSFTGTGTTLGSVSFYLQKQLSPTGNLTAEIFAHTGTYGSGGTGTGAALATSATVNATTVPSSYGLVTFTFSGANQITLANGTNYVVVLSSSGSSSTNYVSVGIDSSSPSHSGNRVSFNTSLVWVAQAGHDTIFYVNDTSGSFTAGKISEDGIVDDVQITASNYTEHLYSLTLVSSALSNGDTVDFRALRNGNIIDTYTVTPRITVTKSGGGGPTGYVKVKVGGVFVSKPIKYKIGGTFTAKSMNQKSGGTFTDTVD